MVQGLNQLGKAYLQVGNTAEAVKTFNRGIAIFESSRLNDLRVEAELFAGLGQGYLAQSEFSPAIENYSKALRLAERRGLTLIFQTASSGLGEISLSNRTIEKSALPFCESHGLPSEYNPIDSGIAEYPDPCTSKTR